MSNQNDKTHPKNGVFGIVSKINHDDNEEYILLVREKGKKWSLTGGGIEAGELPSESLLRELREEAGVEVSELNLIAMFKAGHLVLLYNIMRWDDRKAVQPGSEIEECGFFSKSQIRDMEHEIYPAQFKMIGYYHFRRVPDDIYEGILSPGFEREPAWPKKE